MGVRRENKLRLRWLYRIVMVAILVCVARLVQLMVFQADKIQNKVERQWTREVSVAPLRGSILDRNGEILAATATTQSILLYPKEIKDAGEVADLLAPILEMDATAMASDTGLALRDT